MATFDKTRKDMLDARAEYQALKAKANLYEEVLQLIEDEGADGAIAEISERIADLQEPMQIAKDLDNALTRKVRRMMS